MGTAASLDYKTHWASQQDLKHWIRKRCSALQGDHLTGPDAGLSVLRDYTGWLWLSSDIWWWVWRPWSMDRGRLLSLLKPSAGFPCWWIGGVHLCCWSVFASGPDRIGTVKTPSTLRLLVSSWPIFPSQWLGYSFTSLCQLCHPL